MTRRIPLLAAALSTLAVGGALLIGPTSAGAIVVPAPPIGICVVPGPTALIAPISIPIPVSLAPVTIELEFGNCAFGS
jgi:hypothetical protein